MKFQKQKENFVVVLEWSVIDNSFWKGVSLKRTMFCELGFDQ